LLERQPGDFIRPESGLARPANPADSKEAASAPDTPEHVGRASDFRQKKLAIRLGSGEN